MATEYFAFIQPLRDNPDDETLRLAYTDWLDERADPRAEYLRTEAAWVALQPGDEQYRPLYRDLSRLAALQDPTWFTWVGRLAPLVRRAWEPLSAKFATGSNEVDLPRAWAKAARDLGHRFAEAFGGEAAARRFCPPVDLAAFLCAVGRRGDGWNFFSGSEAVAGNTAASLRIYEPAQPAPDGLSNEELAERPEHPEMWLDVGGWSDKHWYYVCCDLESPLFGTVAEGHDYHPWMAGIEPLDFRGRNYLHFLTGYWPDQERGWESWSGIPHNEWGMQ